MIGIAGFILLVLLAVVSVEGLRWTLRPEARRVRKLKKIGELHVLGGKWVVEPRRQAQRTPRAANLASFRHFVIVGTSGSRDYLEDPNKDKRFWADLKLTTSESDELRDLNTNPDDSQEQEMP